MSRLKNTKKQRQTSIKVKKHDLYRSSEFEGQGKILTFFIGRETIIPLMGFAIGSTFVARSLWEYASYHWGLDGLPFVIIVGVFLFVGSGAWLHMFRGEHEKLATQFVSKKTKKE